MQQYFDIQECWCEPKIHISVRKKAQEKVFDEIQACCLQYMVQRRCTILNKILEECKCCVDSENSKKFLTICLLDPKNEDEDLPFENTFKNIIEKLSPVWKHITFRKISFNEAEFHAIEKEFYESEKKFLEDGSVQVLQTPNKQYLVVVGRKDEVKKSFACLEKLCKEVSIEQIKNREMFNVLKVKEKLEANFKKVQIQDKECFLVLRGSEHDLAKCNSFIRRCSDLKNLCRLSRKISEKVCSILKLDKTRNDIYTSLMDNGFHVYWTVSKNEYQCVLICYGLEEQGLDDALELIMNEGDETTKVAKNFLSKGNVQRFEHTSGVLRIKRGITYELAKRQKEHTEKNASCSILLAKREVEEPSYYQSWIFKNRNIVIAEGNVENSVTDIIVCPVDENFQPAGESAERIFQKGRQFYLFSGFSGIRIEG